MIHIRSSIFDRICQYHENLQIYYHAKISKIFNLILFIKDWKFDEDSSYKVHTETIVYCLLVGNYNK